MNEPYSKRRRLWWLAIVGYALFITTTSAFAYPSREVVATGGPPFDVGVSDTLAGMLLTNDSTLVIAFGQVLRIIDMGTFAQAATQPAALTTAAGTDGVIAAIAYDSANNAIVASQLDGDLLIFNLNDLTANPKSVTLAAGKKLGPVVVDHSGVATVANLDEHKLHVVRVASRSVTRTVPLTISGTTAFTVTDGVFDGKTQTSFWTTDAGVIFVVPSGASAATAITVGTSPVIKLPALAISPDGAFVYAVDATTPGLVKIDAATQTILKKGTTISLAANSNPSDIVVTDVQRPVGGVGTGIYAFVAGHKGVSVVNTVNDEVFDLGNPDDTSIAGEPIPTSVVPLLLAASSSQDGFIALGNTTGTIGLLTANPWVTVSALTYGGGDTTLGTNESATLTFRSDTTGTYEVKLGGDVTASGTTLTADGGAAAVGTVASANTDITVTFNYADNSSLFIEGDNSLFVFVTDVNGNRGRRVAKLTVDTPPPVVTIESVGFGTARLYVNCDRLPQADIDHYNMYVSPDAAEVMTKTSVDLAVGQPASGATVTGVVTGLNNGTTYNIAVEAVDRAGNTSATRTTTLVSGDAATGLPQLTYGPAGLAGETGCAMSGGSSGGTSRCGIFFLLGAIALLCFARHLPVRRRACWLMLIIVILCAWPITSHARTESPQLWSMELKSGFWFPVSHTITPFFSGCCHLITRAAGGLLVHRRYGLEAGIGYFTERGVAIGGLTGTASQDRFQLTLMPTEMNLVWRVDYFRWRWLVPYLKAGADGVYFHETDVGHVIQGMKYGMHGTGGIQLQLTKFSDGLQQLDADAGINDVFMLFEAEYRWIDSFGKNGLDLSGPLYSVGLLFEF